MAVASAGDGRAIRSFLDTIDEILHEDVRADFKKSFSIAHVKTLIQEHVRDYGGDFQRFFDGTYRWVDAGAV